MAQTNWRNRKSSVSASIKLNRWLVDEGSLTARIKARCRDFRVSLLSEGIARPQEHERGQVELRRAASAWIREVLLIADGRPVVFARSIAARCGVLGPWRMLAGIGTRPLGEALFQNPLIKRRPIELARIAESSALHRHAESAVNGKLPMLWARRSRFLRDGQALLVTEVFLPAIIELA